MNIAVVRTVTLWFLLGALPARAQFGIAPLSTFVKSGWLAPNGYNGSTYAYATTNDTERGLAYGNNHLYLVSRNGGDFIRVLDAQTGADLGALNLGSGVVTGGTFDVNMVAVGGDGAIYVGNLATGPTPFKVYRWANDSAATTPTLVVSAVPLAGARVGDTIAAIGSGGSTLLVAGFNNTPGVTGDNGYAIIDPTAGTATAVGFSGTPPMAGDFRLGISFTDSGHVVGLQGGTGSNLRYTSFSGSTGTLLASPALTSTDERAVSFAQVAGIPLLATLSTADNHVSIYNMADPTQPVLVGQANATSGTLAADAHNTGAVTWGNPSGNSATLYAMATDDGIQAFVVKVPAPTAPQISSQPQNQSVPELSPATFQVVANGIPAPSYQWYRGDTAIVGETNASYAIPAARVGDNGAQFHVVVQNTVSNITSSVATLTVIADTNAPVLLAAHALGFDRVQAAFSERIAFTTATNLANYSIASASGSLTVNGASLDASQSNALLNVSLMTEGQVYTLTVNNLADQSAAGNIIAPNSQISFVSSAYTSSAIGNPALAGGQTAVAGGYDLEAGGAGIGGLADECNLSYQSRVGDFDVAVRLTGLSPADVWAKAGLMARETLDGSSRFAGVFATQEMVGSFFEWRDPANSASRTSGSFPGNYPYTWLRLSRAGATFSGFASYDGQTWTQLGSAGISMPPQVYLGMAAASHNVARTTIARFRDIGDVSNAAIGSVTNPREPLGPCSRRTPLVISEILYKPAARTDLKNLEFIELYNSNPWWEDLSGYRLTGDVLYTFPSGTILPGGGFLVVSPAPADLQSVYGITNVVGPSSPASKRTGLIQLRDEQDAILLELSHGTVFPWPAGANGTGHSIVLARPSYGEADPRAWAISDVVGGSPGGPEAYRPSPLRSVVINEFLPHPDASRLAYIELYNHSAISVNLSGCVLTDSAQSNQFTLPTNTVISAGGFLAFDQHQMGFPLSPGSGLLLFKAPDGSRVLDAVNYEAQGLNVSFGRWPDGAADFYPLASNTPAAPNGSIRIGDIVLNEIMYKPISGNDDDQYVELYNQGANALDLSGWRFTSGLHFTFAPGTVIGPGAYLVVARNATNLFNHYVQLNPANTVGNFTGKLSHKGERLALGRPEAVVATNSLGVASTNSIFVVEDEVTFGAGGRWGQWAHGGGSSLELIHPNTNHRLPDNWADSDETSKSSWTNLEVTGVLDYGASYNNSPVNLVQLGLLDVGECLVDNLELIPGITGPNYITNPDFEGGLSGWTPQGDHLRSSLETVLGGYQSSNCLHLRASDGVWTLFNSVQGTLTNTTLRGGSTATLRLKGRWLRGSPEILMRVRGNWIELTGALPVPANLGTPGLPNSRATAGPGPAIYEVSHTPPLPPANQTVLVSARFHDRTDVQPTLLYRVDTSPNPTPTYTRVTMVDDGTGGDGLAGDGIYTARIPGQAAGTVVAFIIQARNSAGALTVFPSVLADNSGLPRECVIAFGDPVPQGSFDHEHVWMTQNWINRWASLGGLSNENHDGTFVDGYSGRVIYNWAGRFAGSPYHQYTGSPVTTLGGQHWFLPEDDKLFGTASFNKQHLPGNGPLDDDTLQREQTSYWMARQVGMPWNYRRFYILYVNGNRHGPLMEDSQVPGADVIQEHWPNDANGFLYKNNSWFEGDTTIQPGGYMNFTMPSWCLLGRFVTTINGVPNQYKLGRYRWMYWIRQYPDSANNFTNVFALITAANAPLTSPSFYSNMEALVDTEEFMRMSALEHATGDWDSWFTQNQWNMYVYKPIRGKLTALKWDWNITLGGGTTTWPSDGSQLFNVGANDPVMAKFQNYTPYRRAYLRAFEEIAARAMNSAYANPVVDKKYAAFVANGLTTTAYSGLAVRDPGAPGGLKSWIATMHNSLLRALTNQGVAGVTFAVNGPTNFTVGANVVTLTGTAPVEVKDITVNHALIPVTWTTVKNWQMTMPLADATNVLAFQGINLHGDALSNMTAIISIINTNAVAVTLNPVVINEWMANNNNTLADPADGMVHDWFELFNPNPAIVDLSGYYLTDKLDNKTKWPIPAGTAIAPFGFLLVWADGGLTNSDHDLHANFKLAKAGSAIALFDPRGGTNDAVTFGLQAADVSQGRWPDGSGDIYPLAVPTPKAPNQFVNSPPVLGVLPDQTALAGQLLTLRVTASDPDSPPQALTFSLDSSAPSGAQINSTNGVFTRTLPLDEAPGTNVITIHVTDNGVPALTDTKPLVIVVPRMAVSYVGLTPDGLPTFTLTVQPGRTYRVESKSNLEDLVWQAIADVPATSTTLTFTDLAASGFGQRFYRIRLLP
jgi:hypothetical protein